MVWCCEFSRWRQERGGGGGGGGDEATWLSVLQGICCTHQLTSYWHDSWTFFLWGLFNSFTLCQVDSWNERWWESLFHSRWGPEPPSRFATSGSVQQCITAALVCTEEGHFVHQHSHSFRLLGLGSSWLRLAVLLPWWNQELIPLNSRGSGACIRLFALITKR